MTYDDSQFSQENTTENGPRPRVVEGGKGLVVTRIGKSFKQRPVVRSVSLSVKRGEVIGLLGPNGLIPTDTGSIEVDGHDVTSLPMYRRARLGIGYLPQEASIFRGLTAEQNIRATAELIEPDPMRLEAAVEALLAEFGITHVRNTPAIALSGGERRRVEIARALATHPSYILLDEPLAGIDPIAVGEIRDLVRHLKDRGIGVLITDHNVRDALEIIDRAYILHDGRVLMEGTPAEIVSDRDVRRVYLGEKFSLWVSGKGLRYGRASPW
jgi:lipopolysaccharide export system ATP-binding protein